MKRAFVLGIDGLPFTLASRLIEDEVMPNLGRVARQGTLARLHTTVPDFSCVAWTSFATGVNPGRHGIYGFQDFHPKDASNYLPTVLDCKAPALWHAVGQAGGRSVILNLPGTYPALPLRGKMVAGFVIADFDKACYPPAFAQTLRNLGYRTEFDGVEGLSQPEHVRSAIGPVFEARKTAIRHLIKNEAWDLAVAVITETDRLQHFYQHALYNPAHPDHAWVRQFYVELDAFIGEVAELLDGKADLFMVSDHGFEVVRKTIIVQDVLEGLQLAPPSERPGWMNPETAARTKVFSLDPGRFYINRKNSRFPHGIVEESEVPEILATLSHALRSLTDAETGEHIVNTIRLKDEAFWGDTTGYAPDLVAATHPGYYFRAFWHGEETGVKEIGWEANHVWNDAIVFTPYPLSSDYQPMIWDVLPSALARMGIELPANIDGRGLAKSGEAAPIFARAAT